MSEVVEKAIEDKRSCEAAIRELQEQIEVLQASVAEWRQRAIDAERQSPAYERERLIEAIAALRGWFVQNCPPEGAYAVGTALGRIEGQLKGDPLFARTS